MNDILECDYTYLTILSKEIDKIKKDLKLKIKSEKENEIKFLCDMETNTLIKKLANYKIDKLFIENISLEDLFEEYYK